jgi:hypothetical protein
VEKYQIETRNVGGDLDNLLEIAANRPPRLLKRLRKDFASRFCLCIGGPKDFENANDGVCARSCGAVDTTGQADTQKFAPPHMPPPQKPPLGSARYRV